MILACTLFRKVLCYFSPLFYGCNELGNLHSGRREIEIFYTSTVPIILHIRSSESSKKRWIHRSIYPSKKYKKILRDTEIIIQRLLRSRDIFIFACMEFVRMEFLRENVRGVWNIRSSSVHDPSKPVDSFYNRY